MILNLALYKKVVSDRMLVATGNGNYVSHWLNGEGIYYFT